MNAHARERERENVLPASYVAHFLTPVFEQSTEPDTLSNIPGLPKPGVCMYVCAHHQIVSSHIESSTFLMPSPFLSVTLSTELQRQVIQIVGHANCIAVAYRHCVCVLW